MSNDKCVCGHVYTRHGANRAHGGPGGACDNERCNCVEFCEKVTLISAPPEVKLAEAEVKIQTLGAALRQSAARNAELVEALRGALSHLAAINWSNRGDNPLVRARAALAKAGGKP